jgi:hypothetical protein
MLAAIQPRGECAALKAVAPENARLESGRGCTRLRYLCDGPGGDRLGAEVGQGRGLNR